MIVAVAPSDKALAYGQCLAFSEYCQLQEELSLLLKMRYNETRLTPAAQLALSTYSENLYVVALVTDEDPDTTAVLPIIARLIDASPRAQLRILSDDFDLTPLAVLAPDIDMAAALEEWDLPQFFVFDDEWEIQGQWGPRPEQAERNLEEWLSRYPEYESLAEDESAEAQRRYATLTDTLMHEMRLWYNSSLSAACQTEFCEVLAALAPSDESNESES